MASSSSPISSALSTRISPPNIIPQSWYQWTVSNFTIKTAVIGIVGALVVWTLHRLFNSSESSQPTGRVSQNTPPPKPTIVSKNIEGKTLPIPVPAHELNAQGFIRIYKNLFDYLGAPPGYKITEIKVRIEDDEGKRIATRYLPDFEDDHDIFSHLPFDRFVYLQFKVTCRHPNREPLIQEIPAVELGVTAQAAVYHVKSQNQITCVPLENHPTQTLQWHPQRPETKTKLCPTRLSIFSGHPLTEGRNQGLQKEIVVQNYDGNCVRRIAIVLKCHLITNQLTDVLCYAFVGNNGEKCVPFRFLIKDWKAAYQLENGTKIDYKNHDLAHFHIDSVTCESYVVKA